MSLTKIINLERLKRRLNRIPNEVRLEVLKAVGESAHELVAFQKAYVPVDQGDLKESIDYYAFTKGGRLGFRVKAGSKKAFYAAWVEFGTVQRGAQAFFFPAYRALKKKMRTRHARALRNAVKKVARS